MRCRFGERSPFRVFADSVLWSLDDCHLTLKYDRLSSHHRKLIHFGIAKAKRRILKERDFPLISRLSSYITWVYHRMRRVRICVLYHHSNIHSFMSPGLGVVIYIYTWILWLCCVCVSVCPCVITDMIKCWLITLTSRISVCQSESAHWAQPAPSACFSYIYKHPGALRPRQRTLSLPGL